MQNPYVFVVGCPRSGTTLLQRMLDNHPQLAIANDTHFIPRALEDEPGGINPKLTDEIVERVRRYHRFPRLNLPDEVVLDAARGGSSYQEFVSALYSSYAGMHGKPLGGEKTPDYARYLPVLHGLFPWAKIVHLIRDGRNVALSALEWARQDKGPGRFRLWVESPIAVCALWWRWQVSTGRCDGAALGPQLYDEIRYEELVSKPDQVLQELSAFLRLPFSVEMLKYYEGKTRLEPGLSAKNAWLPPTPGLRDWHTQMSARDLELFEALAGDLLSELGYERSIDLISPEIAALAGLYRLKWEAEIEQRQAKKIRRMSLAKNRRPGFEL